MESEEEEDKKDDEEMDVDTGKKLPKRYANQVSSPGKVRPRSSPTEVSVAVKREGDRRKEWGTSEKLLYMHKVYGLREEMAYGVMY